MINRMRAVKQTLALLSVSLMAHHPLPAWERAGGSPPLEIQVLEGDRVTHAIGRRRHKEPVVLVRSEGQPVKGAHVVFRLPDSGPSGSFGSNGKAWGGTTGKNGRAVGKGFVANKELGDYVIRVTASHRGETADAQLEQTNAWLDSTLAGKKIKVTLNDGRTIKGPVSEITREGFTIVDRSSQQPVSVANEEVAKLSVQRLSTGKKVLIGVGLGLGIAVAAVLIAGATGTLPMN